MPNWCFTTYRIFGPKEDRDRLLNAIEELKSLPKPRVDNGFGNLWLGCLVDYFGGDWNTVYCRGEITDYEDEDNCLRINTETAWAEMLETRHFLEGVLPNLRFFYISEEDGMCEYYTNDKDRKVFPYRYYLDTCDFDDIEKEEFLTIEDAAEYIKKRLPDLEFEPTVESINDAFEDLMEQDGYEDKYINLREYVYDEGCR